MLMNQKLERTLVVAEAIFASLVFFARFLIHLVLYNGGDELDPTVAALMNLFGFIKLSLDDAYYVVPDFSVMIVAGLMYFKYHRSPSADRKDLPRNDKYSAASSAIITYSFLPLVFLVSVSFCSAINIVYFFVFVGSVIMLLGGKTVYTVVHTWYIWIYYITILCLLATYSFQIQYIHDLLVGPEDRDAIAIINIIGLEFWRYMDLSTFSSWLVIINWMGLLGLFTLCSSINHMFLQWKNSHKDTNQKHLLTNDNSLALFHVSSQSDSSKSLSPSSLSSHFTFWGWPFALLLLITTCLSMPSFIGFVIYLFVAVGCFVVDPTSSGPKSRFHSSSKRFHGFWRNLVITYNIYGIPILVFYLIISSTIQYMYNIIPIHLLTTCGPAWCYNIGLVTWSTTSTKSGIFTLQMSLRGLTTCFVAVYGSVIRMRVHVWNVGNEDTTTEVAKIHHEYTLLPPTDQTDQGDEEEQDQDKQEEAKQDDQPLKQDITPTASESTNFGTRDYLSVFVQFLVSHSYKLSLALLYFTALLSANLLNAGYMLFFIIFAVSERVARIGWIVLVIYCQCVIAATLLWQGTWAGDIQTEHPAIFREIGLYRATGNIFQGVYMHLFILLLTSLQWHINTFQRAVEAPSLPPFLGVLSDKWLQSISIERMGLTICYVVIILVAMFGAPGDTGTFALDLVSLGYLLFCAICFLVNVIIPFRASQTIKIYWSVVILFSGIMMIALYVYQFPDISTWFSAFYNTTGLQPYFPLELLGLRNLLNETFTQSIHYGSYNIQNPATIGKMLIEPAPAPTPAPTPIEPPTFSLALALGLLGHTLVFISSVYQLTLFYASGKSKSISLHRDRNQRNNDTEDQDSNDGVEEDKNDNVDADNKKQEDVLIEDDTATLDKSQNPKKHKEAAILILENTVGPIWRWILLHHSIISVFLIFAIILFWVDEPICPAHFFIVVLLISSCFSQSSIGNVAALTLIICWVLLFAESLFAISSLRQLLPREWQTFFRWFGLDPAHISLSMLINMIFTDDSNSGFAPLFSRIWGYIGISIVILFQRYASVYLNEHHRKASKSIRPLIYSLTLFNFNKHFTKCTAWDRLKWYLSYFWTIHSDALFILSLLLACYVHQGDVMGLFYALCLGFTSFILTGTSEALYIIFYSIIVLLIMLQYFFSPNVRLPPEIIPINKTFQFFDAQTYLLMNKNDYNLGWNIMTDTVVILCTVWHMHVSSPAGLEQLKNTNSTFREYYHHLVECSYSFDDVYSRLNKSVLHINWAMVRFSFIQFSPFWILLFVFSVGTIHSEILSLGYLGFSLFLLSNLDYLLKHKNSIWRWGRWMNFTFILLRIIYQVPYINENIQKAVEFTDVILPLFGFQVAGQSNGVAEQILVLDLIIFALLNYQKRLFEIDDFDLVMRVKAKDRYDALQLAVKRYREYKDDIEEKKQELKLQSQQRKIKLLQIQARREKRLLRRRKQMNVKKNTFRSDDEDFDDDSVDDVVDEKPEADDAHEKDYGSDTDPSQITPEGAQLSRWSTLKRKKKAKTRPFSELLPSIYDWQVVQVHATPSKPTASEKTDDAQQPKTTLDGDDPVFTESVKSMIKRNLLKIVDALIDLLDRHCYENLQDYQTRFEKLIYGIFGVFARNCHLLVYLVILINVYVYHNILALMYPLALFMYGIFESPRPSKYFFRFLFFWTMIVICIKFLAQIPVFCTCVVLGADTSSEVIFYSVQPYCSPPSCITSNSYREPTLLSLLGIEKSTSQAFVQHVFCDVLILIALSLNQYLLKRLGLWDFVASRVDTIELTDSHLDPEEKIEEQKHREETKRKVSNRLTRDRKASKSTDSTAPVDQNQKGKLPRDSILLEVTGDVNKISGEELSERVSDKASDGEEDSPIEKKEDKDKADKIDMSDEEDITDKGDEHKSSLGKKDADKNMGDDDKSEKDSDRDDEKANISIDDLQAQVHSMDQSVLDALDLSDPEDESEHSPTVGNTTTTTTTSTTDLPLTDSTHGKPDDATPHQPTTTSVRTKVKKFFNKTKLRLVRYFQYITSPKKLGVDYYAPIFLIDLISFIILALFPREFIGEGNNIVQFFSQNRLPTPFVLLLLMQFLLIVAERVIYLFRATRVKLVLLYVLVVFYHVILFISIPMAQRLAFYQLKTVGLFYILKCLYFFFSGLQIRDGYPSSLSTNRVFQSDMKNPGYLDMTFFSLYRAIPFVYELRTLLDWTITPTTLNYYEYFKLEDIFAELYMVKVRIVADRNTERKVGDAVPRWSRYMQGGGMFIIFCLILWSPLLVFTQGANSGVSNNVNQVTFTVGMTGYVDFFTSYEVQGVNIHQLPVSNFTVFLDYYQRKFPSFGLFNLEDAKSTALVAISVYSEYGWSITPPARASLLRLLCANVSNDVSLTTTLKFRRPNPPDQELPYTYSNRKLNTTELQQLCKVVNRTQPNITLSNVIPRVYRLPSASGSLSATDGKSDPTTSFASATFSLTFREETINTSHASYTTVSEFWEITPVLDEDSRSPFNINVTTRPDDDGVKILVISTPYAEWLPESIAVTGIIGLYTVFVLGVGRFLRMYVTELSHKVIYEDMPEVDNLLEFCTDILLAREDGALELEEELYRELIEIYRSPQRIIKHTHPTQPRWKQPSSTATQ